MIMSTMNGDLRSTLDELTREGSTANPAFNALLADYARYHLVLAVLGSAFLLAFVVLGGLSWKRFRSSPPSGRRRWTFPKLTHLAAVALSVGVGLVLALVVAANLGNALDPRPGLAGAVPLIDTPRPDTPRAELQHAFDDWLQSGSTRMPAPVRRAVDDRLAWQRPKAVVSGVLLLIFLALGARTWRALLDRNPGESGRWRPGDVALLAAGLGEVAICLLLMLMVVANTQASLAPVAMTLFYG